MEEEISNVKEMISYNGFEKVYLIFCRLCDITNKEAYERTEEEYNSRYNAGRRYASYNSFRIIKNRHSKIN